MRHPVLVKLFDPAPSDDAEGFTEGLAQAAARAALVQHPNVAQVFECGEESGRAFLVTEDVPGVSLERLSKTLAERGDRLGFDVALFLACEVADALAGALSAPGRVLHGDLSSRQVILGWSGSVKVTDFEIGRVTMAHSGVRSLRTEASRLENLAPELVRGSTTTARSDVFALGMLLRALFVGSRFAEGTPHAEALRMVREGEVWSPSFRARIPRELAELLLTATAVSPEERYASARSLASELRGIAFRHGVGDARPFLARALDRAFPAERLEGEGEDDELDEPDDDGQTYASVYADDDGDEGEGDEHGEPHDSYDSDPAPRTDLATAHAVHEHAEDDYEGEEDDEPRAPHDDDEARGDWDDDEPAPESDDLARTSLLRVADDLAKTSVIDLRPRRSAESFRQSAHEDDDFDPEATVNLRG